ncbi:Os10g0522000, partial [Oryza sativa Japonica Group]
GIEASSVRSASRRRRRRCRTPAPPGGAAGPRTTVSRYRAPFPWPASRGVVWAGNSARGAKAAADAAAAANKWARVDGDMLRFTDAAAVRAYAYVVLRLVAAPVRAAVDVGAMHGGSWAAELMSRGVVTVSVAAPWGASDGAALVELALERGVPAVLAAAGGAPSRRLPFPAGAFDMAHCGRCLVPWHLHGGRFLMEIDRVLRPGGYWVHSARRRTARMSAPPSRPPRRACAGGASRTRTASPCGRSRWATSAATPAKTLPGSAPAKTRSSNGTATSSRASRRSKKARRRHGKPRRRRRSVATARRGRGGWRGTRRWPPSWGRRAGSATCST